MASNYPTSLDNFTNPTGTSSLTSPDHAGQHSDLNDAVEQLQAKVGVNGSAVTTSLDYQVANMIPRGTIWLWAGTEASALSLGWLVCDGSAVSRTTYAGLFTVIGTTYGAGNGSTTFNLPNLRGRVPVGRSASGTFVTLGGSGGAETHTLTSAEMPSHTHVQNAHNHGITDNGHSHTYNNWVFFVQSQLVNGYATSSNTGNLPNSPSTNSQTTGITINNQTATNQNTGGGGAHNNLQPYLVLNYIIRP